MEEQQQQAYLDKVNARIKEFSAKLDQLKAKADQVDAETKIKYNQQIEKLLHKKQEMETKLNEIKVSGKGAWSNLKIGLDAAMSDLKTGIEKAISEFKK
jgi:cell fate (sporulation/competence/biofilm development) regulator YmcA (YheA/YmcA/DUF963 family)